MSSSSVARQRFYEKSYLAGLLNFVMGRREETQDKHPMLKLHECLATICVAKARREVIACYIEAAVGSARRSTLHMSRNDNWEATAKEYVAKVLGILAEMSSSSSTSSEGLQKEVYEYCKEKVEHRIKKFLRTVKSVLEDDLSKTIQQIFPHDTRKKESDKALQQIVDVIKHDLEKLQQQLAGGVTPPSGELLKNHPEKSGACRNTAAKWESNKGVLEVVREKFPYIEKRMLKVASYSRSIDVLSEWAKGAGVYAESGIKQAYPVPAQDHVEYKEPTTEQPANLMGPPLLTWDAVAQKHYPGYATDAALTKLKDLNPSLAKSSPPTLLYLHAEMHFVQTLLSLSPPPQHVYIGISKLCCYLCYHCIRRCPSFSSHPCQGNPQQDVQQLALPFHLPRCTRTCSSGVKARCFQPTDFERPQGGGMGRHRRECAC